MKNRKTDFPIFEQTINGYPLTYLDSAATSQKPQSVIDSLVKYYETYNSNVRRAIYPLAEKATVEVENVREDVAAFINASSKDEIVFVRNTTEALNLVASSLSRIISKDDTIATTILEHHSNFVPWQMMAARTGAWFEIIDVNNDYSLDLPDFSQIKILAITHVSNVLGTVHDLKSIIKKARKDNPNIIVIVDGAQSVPHMKVDVQDIDCDFFAFSGHKTYAGMGVGVLYGKRERLENLDPFLFGGEMISEVTVEQTTFQPIPHKFEAGTPAVSEIISLGKALSYLNDLGLEHIEQYESELVSYALKRLTEEPDVSLIGQKDAANHSSVIAFTLGTVHPHDVAQILGDQGVCIRAGHHCCMPLHKRLGLVASCRLSLSFYNDTKDIDRFIKGLSKVRDTFAK